MPRRSKAESDATQARILEAAQALFAERGYAGVALDDVAKVAHVTRGAVYHHFGSKLGLFEAVHVGIQRAVAEEIDRQTAEIADPGQALEIGCRAFLAASVSPQFRRVLLLDGPAVLGWATWRSLDAAHSGTLLDAVLHELQAAGRLTVPSARAAAVLLSGAMNEAALWLADADRTASDIDSLINEIWSVLTALLRAIVTDAPRGARSPRPSARTSQANAPDSRAGARTQPPGTRARNPRMRKP